MSLLNPSLDEVSAILFRIRSAWATLCGRPFEWSVGNGRILFDEMYVTFDHCNFEKSMKFGTNKGLSFQACYFAEATFEDGNPFYFATGNRIASSPEKK